jgi:hypothetical protein
MGGPSTRPAPGVHCPNGGRLSGQAVSLVTGSNGVWRCEREHTRSRQVIIRTVSGLCQMIPETPLKQLELRRRSDAHRCCGKSLIETALVGVDAREHARPESISKRAPSTTRTSLHFRINDLRAVGHSLAQNAPSNPSRPRRIWNHRFTRAPNAIIVEIVSDLLMSFDHLRRFSRRSVSISADKVTGRLVTVVRLCGPVGGP